MLHKLISVAAAGVALAFSFVAPAAAVTVGVPVGGIGSNTQVGLPLGTGGRIDFFIPLDGTETYGVSGGGMSTDNCSRSGCTGRLNMFLKFNPVTAGANIVTLKFTDLDLFGVNDPSGFLESVEFFDNGNASLGLVDQSTDTGPSGLKVVSAETNALGQLLQVLVPNISPNNDSSYWAKLVFRTSGAPRNSMNTIESMYASISPVPLPAALPLFASGLALFGVYSRRRKRTADRAMPSPAMTSS